MNGDMYSFEQPVESLSSELIDSWIDHYQDVISEQAQAAAAVAVGLPILNSFKGRSQTSPNMCEEAVVNTVVSACTQMKADEQRKPKKAGIYECEKCGYSTKWSHCLMNHIRLHEGNEFRCSYCDYTTVWKQDLKDHMRQHLGTMFECVQCSFTSNKKQGFDKHMRIHTGEKPYKCSVCSYSCNQKSNLNKHTRKHRKVVDESSQKAHAKPLRQTSGKKSEEDQPSETSQSMCSNVALPPDQIFHHVCSICSFKTDKAKKYLEHVIANHIEDGKYYCLNLCLKSFSSSCLLHEHQQNHC